MKIENSVALVTGANRGIGAQFARDLLRRGASKVYAAARDTGRIDVPGIEPLEIDITDPRSVAAAADVAGDVTLLVNNAGIDLAQDLVAGDLAQIRREMETNLFGTLSMIRAFSPALARNGGGAIVNVLSAASWFTVPGHSSYAVTKAAAWSLTNGVRLELASQGTLVTGVHVGLVDTDLTANLDLPKMKPAEFVRITLDGVEDGRVEIVADDLSLRVKGALSGVPGEFAL